MLAPTHKRQVAIATFVVGTMVAIYMGLDFEGVAAAVVPAAAIIAGGIVLALLLRRRPLIATLSHMQVILRQASLGDEHRVAEIYLAD